MGYPLIGCWYWEQSLSSLYVFQVLSLGYVEIINNLNFDFNYADVTISLILVVLACGFSFPSPITPVGLASPSSHLFHSNVVAVAVPALKAGCIALI
jgi:hypothetical protein